MSTDWPARLAQASAELTAAHEARDRAIIDAAASGFNPTAIARAVGLSRMQVYRIINPDRAT